MYAHCTFWNGTSNALLRFYGRRENIKSNSSNFKTAHSTLVWYSWEKRVTVHIAGIGNCFLKERSTRTVRGVVVVWYSIRAGLPHFWKEQIALMFAR
jgi:hypothetical protein